MESRNIAAPLMTLKLLWGELTFPTLIYGFVLTTLGADLRFSFHRAINLLARALGLGALLFVTYALQEKKIVP
jgi:hypothetical protein